MFIAISTSGNSANIVRALQAAAELDLVTVGFSGAGGGAMAELCQHCVKIPSTDTPRIQEGHITVGHILCASTERVLFGRD